MTTTVNKEDLLPLPKDKMPDCWFDDERMNSLYAPFRQRNVNPLDWDYKMKFWSSLINDWCIHKDSASFTHVELRNAFRRGGRSPLGFPTVIDTMLRNKDLCKYAEFVTVPPERTWAGWTMDMLVKKPLVWSFQKVVDSLVTASVPPEDEEQFVNVIAAKTQGETLLSAVDDNSRDHLYELEELSKIFALKTGSEIDISIAIHWLRQAGKAAITNSTEGNCVLVKLARSTDTKAVITEFDLVVDAMYRNEKKLKKIVEQLDSDKVATMDEARAYIKKGMRELAKNSLRKKQALEKNINNRVSALENVQMLLGRIKEAKTDGEVMDAYKKGVAALKATFKESDLTEDTAANTLTDVEEVLDIHNEIQTTLSLSIGGSGDEDLEGELEALLMTDPSPPPPPDTGSAKKPSKKTAEDDLENRLKALRLPSLPDLPLTKPTPGKDFTKRATQM